MEELIACKASERIRLRRMRDAWEDDGRMTATILLRFSPLYIGI